MDSWKNPTSVASLLRFPPLYSYTSLLWYHCSEQVPENKELQFRIWTDILVSWVNLKKVWSISLQECPIFVKSDIKSVHWINLSDIGEAPMSLRKEIVSYMCSKGIL